MTEKVVTVDIDDRLQVVREIFQQCSFHHLLVVADEKLVGVLSDRDLFKAISPHLGTAAETEKDRATLNKRVHMIMSRQPITLPPEASLWDAIELFRQHSISCIPVVDKFDRPVGILSWRDIFKALKRPAGK